MTWAPSEKTRNFIGLSSFQMLAMFRRGLFYSFLTIYLRHFLGMSVTETTLFATGPMVMNVLFQTFTWGPLSDKWQLRRTFIIAGELLAAAGTLGVCGLERSDFRYLSGPQPQCHSGAAFIRWRPGPHYGCVDRGSALRWLRAGLCRVGVSPRGSFFRRGRRDAALGFSTPAPAGGRI